MSMNIVPQTQGFTCPCCMGFIGEAAPVDKVAAAVTGTHMRTLFEFLASAPGEQVSVRDIEDHLYRNDPDGGPLTSRGNVYVFVLRLNKQIERFGWHVASRGRGRAGGYRLIPMEAQA